jgi:hypothetical protein
MLKIKFISDYLVVVYFGLTDDGSEGGAFVVFSGRSARV